MTESITHGSVLSRQAELLQTAGRVFPGGGLGTFVLPPEVDLVVASGQAGHVTDVAGRDYIDYHLGSGPALLGHAHPEIVAAVQRQLVKGSTYYFLNEPAITLAERMVDAIPCAEQVQYTGSGSEATLYALRLARAATGRQKILKFEGGWHGMNEYALWGTVPTTPSSYPSADADSAGIPRVLASEVLVAPFNDAARATEIIRDHAAELAAVIVEPLQRVLTPVPGFLEQLRDLTRQLGIVLIFDEIVTGFRIAWRGAQERYGVVPDVATYGKAMSGGFPMAAVVGPRELMRYIDAKQTDPGQRVWAGGTLSGNPISAAAGVASLEVLSRPGTYEHLHQLGGRLRRGIKELGTSHGFAVQALGEDAVFGVRFLDNEAPKNWADVLASDKALGLRWALELIKRGVLVNPNEKLYVSIAHTEADVERTLQVVDEAFVAMEQHFP
ncbi:MAG: aspartate aminotransferase family protein [Candidatus Limnocylindrales bacterium]